MGLFNKKKTAQRDPNVPDGVLSEKEKHSKNVNKRELKEEDAESELGYAFSSTKKWWILTVIFIVQTSMNFNTSLYSNGIMGISEQYHVSEQAARVGAAIFLVTYAFGCELWAPWSEEFGRKPVLQASLFLVNIWTIPVALAPNFGTILVGRALGGLSSAGGSVTLGMIADLFDSNTQQYAVAYIVFSSVGGSILGPIIGGFVEQYLDWRWSIWIQLIFGGFVQLLHLFTVPETRTTIMLDRIAKKRRKNGEEVYGPNEIESFWDRFTVKELMHTWLRPFRMFLTEPIVLTLSLLSGFADALIFMQIQSFALVYKNWGFSPSQIGLAFIPIGLGYLIAWLSFIPAIRRNIKMRERDPEDEHAQYESRLTWLLYTAPCLPIGLIIFAWTSTGPPLHWIGSMFGSAIIGIANYAIYMATVDYMIAAYGPYSSSATGGNGWSRDFLAGVLTVPATPFYTNIGAEKGGQWHLGYASTILFCISIVLVSCVYVIYWKGPALRKNSPFAQSLATDNEQFEGRRMSRRYSSASNAARRNSRAEAPEGRIDLGHLQHVNRPGMMGHEMMGEESSSTQAPTPSGVVTPGGTNKTPRDRFGASSRRSSYYSQKHAANRSRNASRRNSMEVSDSENTATAASHRHVDEEAGANGEPLRGLNTIQSVATGH